MYVQCTYIVRPVPAGLRRKNNGRCWSGKVIAVCLRLWCRSPKGYDGLRLSPENEAGFLILPSTRLLQYYKNIVQQKPGVNEENIKWIKGQRHLNKEFLTQVGTVE